MRPYLLSEIAPVFRNAIHLSVNEKDMVEYKDSFSGKNGIDALCSILNTTDRGLALLVGRALDAQNYFHGIPLMF